MQGDDQLKTKAAVAFGVGRPMEVVELDLRDPEPDEVLIRLHSTGVCHSDLSVLDGAVDFGGFPVVLGHEGSGVIEQVGSMVTSLAPGDHVITTVMPQCGRCSECLSGRSNLCQDMYRGFVGLNSPFYLNGKQIRRFVNSGTFTERTVVIESSVAKIPDDAPFDRACLAACGVATGVGAAIEAADIRPGSTVAVFGMGGIGLSAVQGARFAGASRIIAVDTNPAKEAVARKSGATDFINPANVNGGVGDHITTLTNGGADIVVEAVGHPEVARQAMRSTRNGSGECVMVGMMRDGAEITLDKSDIGIGRSFKMSSGGDFKGRYGAAKLVDWYMQGKLDFDTLINDHYPLERINEAMDALREGKVVRNIIDLQS